jgi:hypothetical protein
MADKGLLPFGGSRTQYAIGSGGRVLLQFPNPASATSTSKVLIVIVMARSIT